MVEYGPFLRNRFDAVGRKNMVQLMVDEVTGKVLGFNTIIPNNTKDLVIIDKEEFEKLKKEFDFSKLYYENGQFIEKEELNIDKLNQIEKKEMQLRQILQNEQKIFMDHILSGSSIEEAAAIIKTYREQYEEAKREKEDFWKEHERKRQKKITEKFKKEEENIKNKYFLSIVTAVKNENEYIEEWIDYHVENMGIEHFYIYDNGSDISLKKYLKKKKYKYLDKLTILDWETSNHTQQDTCNDFLKTYANETKWIVCMDVDEFIHVKEDNKTLIDFLQENDSFSRIKCLWKHFTANGQKEKTSLPVRERFTQETSWKEEKHGGKYFAQTNRISNFISYVPQARLNSMCMEHEDKKTTEFFQLNHYITKSYEEWIEKIARGSVNPGFMRKYKEFFEINPDMAYLNTGENTIQTYNK